MIWFNKHHTVVVLTSHDCWALVFGIFKYLLLLSQRGKLLHLKELMCEAFLA